jgi:hypothetical protein
MYAPLGLTLFYSKVESIPLLTQPYSDLTKTGLFLTTLSSFLGGYFTYICLKLYKVNSGFVKSNLLLVRQIVKDKKLQESRDFSC